MSADAQKRIAEIEEELARIERTKTKLQKELATLQAQAATEADAEEAEEEEAEEEEAPEEEETVPEPEPVQAAAPEAQAELSPEEVRAKKIKALNKKLQQIKALKAKGGELDPEAAAKVAKEGLILKQVAALKEGKDLPDEEEHQKEEAEKAARESGEVKVVPLPTDKAEREKRVRTLKKKLQQIAGLKEKTEQLDKDAQEKVASERAVNLEIAALERGDAELTIGPMTEHEKHEEWLARKHDIERKLKAVTKKLQAIDDHKTKDVLDEHQAAKVENEGVLKKEKGDLERQLGALNKEEQLRVASKLGFEQDLKEHHEEKKQAKKKKGR